MVVCWRCERLGVFRRERLIARFGDAEQTSVKDDLTADCPGQGTTGTVSQVKICYARWWHDILRARAYVAAGGAGRHS